VRRLPIGDRARSLTAAIAAMALVNMVAALAPPMLAVVLDRQGVTAGLIGLNAAMMPIGVVLVAPLAPRWIAALGPARVMIRAMLVVAASFPLMAAVPDVYVWLPLRLLQGAALSLCWIASEAWINGLADERTRGRVLSFYSMAGFGGSMSGPPVLVAVGTSGWPPFLAAATLVAAGVLLVALGRDVRPDMAGQASARLWRFLLLAPIAMTTVFIEAGVGQALSSFLPVYALERGLAEGPALLLITAMHAGGLALQYPLGWLADRVNRSVMAVAAVAALALALALIPWALDTGQAAIVFFFVFGGVRAAVYIVGIVLVGQSFRGADLAAASTAFTVMWNIGALAGPSGAGMAMDAVGGDGLMLALALAVGLSVPGLAALALRSGRSG